jgi:hypothetical protein
MTSKNLLFAATLAIILCAGIFLRVHRTSAFDTTVPRVVGYDEGVYTAYIGLLSRAGGIAHYKTVVSVYESEQEERPDAIVHPLRMTFIVASYFWMKVAGCTALTALHAVASLAGVLHLLVAGVFAWRLGGRRALLGVGALMAFAPLQLCLSQRALVDGVYAFGATLCFWLLWENLRAPGNWKWLAAYTISLCALVLTKEYSAFVVFAFGGVMLLNRWLRFGTVTPQLLVATVIGPAVAVLILVYYAGGIGAFIHFYLTFVEKSRTLDYAMKTQDGPWSRYLLDFLIVSPAVLLLAVGRVFQLKKENRPDLYCAVFLLFSYVPMASVTYGMSLRFAAFWDLPMCWLAFSQLEVIAGKISIRRQALALVIATALVCGIELREYNRIFQAVTPHPIYDPITRNLLEDARILK